MIMYKYIKLRKLKSILAINTFRKSEKELSKEYKTGFRYWKNNNSYNYALVLGTFRIIFSKKREQDTDLTGLKYDKNTIVVAEYGDSQILLKRAGIYFEVSLLDGNMGYIETYSTFDEGLKGYNLLKEKYEGGYLSWQIANSKK